MRKFVLMVGIILAGIVVVMAESSSSMGPIDFNKMSWPAAGGLWAIAFITQQVRFWVKGTSNHDATIQEIKADISKIFEKITIQGEDVAEIKGTLNGRMK